MLCVLRVLCCVLLCCVVLCCVVLCCVVLCFKDKKLNQREHLHLRRSNKSQQDVVRMAEPHFLRKNATSIQQALMRIPGENIGEDNAYSGAHYSNDLTKMSMVSAELGSLPHFTQQYLVRTWEKDNVYSSAHYSNDFTKMSIVSAELGSLPHFAEQYLVGT